MPVKQFTSGFVGLVLQKPEFSHCGERTRKCMGRFGKMIAAFFLVEMKSVSMSEPFLVWFSSETFLSEWFSYDRPRPPRRNNNATAQPPFAWRWRTDRSWGVNPNSKIPAGALGEVVGWVGSFGSESMTNQVKVITNKKSLKQLAFTCLRIKNA